MGSNTENGVFGRQPFKKLKSLKLRETLVVEPDFERHLASYTVVRSKASIF